MSSAVILIIVSIEHPILSATVSEYEPTPKELIDDVEALLLQANRYGEIPPELEEEIMPLAVFSQSVGTVDAVIARLLKLT